MAYIIAEEDQDGAGKSTKRRSKKENRGFVPVRAGANKADMVSLLSTLVCVGQKTYLKKLQNKMDIFDQFLVEPFVKDPISGTRELRPMTRVRTSACWAADASQPPKNRKNPRLKIDIFKHVVTAQRWLGWVWRPACWWIRPASDHRPGHAVHVPDFWRGLMHPPPRPSDHARLPLYTQDARWWRQRRSRPDRW